MRLRRRLQLQQCAERASARSSSRCSRALNRELVRGSSVQSMRTMLRKCPQPSSNIHCICPKTVSLLAATYQSPENSSAIRMQEKAPPRPRADPASTTRRFCRLSAITRLRICSRFVWLATLATLVDVRLCLSGFSSCSCAPPPTSSACVLTALKRTQSATDTRPGLTKRSG